jgi:hypothetical protein
MRKGHGVDARGHRMLYICSLKSVMVSDVHRCFRLDQASSGLNNLHPRLHRHHPNLPQQPFPSD